MRKAVLVIVVTYNGEKWIRQCLGSIPAGIADTVVIDNGSSDHTVEMARTLAGAENVICTGANLGFGAANNIGLKMALEKGYEYVYLLNQDAYFQYSDDLQCMIDAHRKNPVFGIISPVQCNREGRTDRQFELKSGISRDMFPAAGDNDKDRTSVCEVPYAQAAHWLMPAEVVRKTGGFSPTFHHYGEDDNLIDRLHHHGYLIGVDTGVQCIHDRGDRVLPKEQALSRKFLIPLIRMSRPGKPWGIVKAALWLAGCSLKNRSITPLRSLPVLWGRRHEIEANRVASLQEGAFL